jgi:CelD/BcsL family acetyltransferase involved in cellulose biosynthesis
MNISIFETFEDAESVWKQFEQTADGYGFQSYDWLSHWYQAVGVGLNIQPCLVLVEDSASQPLLFLPLGIQKTPGLRILIWLGGITADYCAPLVDKYSNEQLASRPFTLLWNDIKQRLPQFDLIHFKNQPENIGDQTNPFVQLGGAPYEISYFSRLKGSWEVHYQQQVKNRIRADSRRQRKRLTRIGELRFVVATESPRIEDITQKMIEQKSRCYRETGAFDLFAIEAYRQFYLQTAIELAPSGRIHVSALMCNDKIIATHWGMIFNERFYFLMPSYEGGKWQKYSSGRLLLEHLIEWCFGHQIEIFDFSIGDERYKQDWCEQTMSLFEYLTPVTSAGYAYVLWHNIKKKVKAVIAFLN